MIHKYFLNGYYIVIDTNSGAVHIVDELAYRLLDFFTEKLKGECPDEIISTLVNEGFDKQISSTLMPNSRLCAMMILSSPKIPTDPLQICSPRRL